MDKTLSIEVIKISDNYYYVVIRDGSCFRGSSYYSKNDVLDSLLTDLPKVSVFKD